MGYTSKNKTKTELEMEKYESRIAKKLAEYDVPIIYLHHIDQIKIHGNQNPASIDSIQPGHTINLTGGFSLMQSTYDGQNSELILHNIHISDKLQFSSKDLALVTDEAVFCNRDVGYMFKRELRTRGYSDEQIWMNSLECATSPWLVEQHKTRVDSELAIQRMVNVCLRDDISIIGIEGSDAESIQLVNGNTNENILLKDITVGDTILVGTNCINQITGEPVEYEYETTVTETCTLGSESFVFTDMGLITDADVSFQIAKAFDKYYKEPPQNCKDIDVQLDEIDEIEWQWGG